MQVISEVLLGFAVGRPVVVCQIEVGNSKIKGAAQHFPLVCKAVVCSEVVPESKRDFRK